MPNVIGLGLIGGSIALGLRAQGWHVSGDDLDPARLALARESGVIDAVDLDPDAVITFVAVPVLAIADQAKRALAETAGVVTDVGSVKGSVCRSIDDPRFLGGHPMAGSELDGLDGAQADMFGGAVWVLTPGADIDDSTFATVAARRQLRSAPTSWRSTPNVTTTWSPSSATCHISPRRP